MGLAHVRGGRGDRPAAGAGPRRPRRREGRQGLDPRQHPARVDLLRLRGPLDRRRRRPDLPDQLARGVPVRPRELGRQGRRRRGRRAAGEDPRRPRAAAEARAGDPDDGLERGRDLARGPRRPRQRRRRRLGEALERGDEGGRLHLHLHLGHDRPAEGVRDHPWQLPLDARHGQRDQRHRGGRRHLPLPPPRPLLRPADPARELRPRGDPRLLGARPAEDPPQPGRTETDLLPLGAADLREDLHRRDQRDGERGRPEKGDLRLGDPGRRQDAGGRTGGPRAGIPAPQAVRVRRQAGALENPRPVRRPAATRRLRRRADQPRHPALLRQPPGSWSSRAGG